MAGREIDYLQRWAESLELDFTDDVDPNQKLVEKIRAEVYRVNGNQKQVTERTRRGPVRMSAEPRHSCKAILRDSVTEDDVRAVTERNGWRYAGDVRGQQILHRAPSMRRGGPLEIVDRFITSWIPLPAKVTWCLWAATRRWSKRVIATIEQSLATWSIDEAFRSYGAAGFAPSRAKAVLLLGLISPARPVEGVMERVRESTHHRDARVRRAAVWAMIYSEWSEYREDLARIASTDSDLEIADEASRALETIDQAEGER